MLVIHGAGGPTLSAYTPQGERLFAVSSCNGYLGPSVGTDGVVATGAGCTDLHDTVGASVWSQPFGDVNTGVALTAGGGVVVLHSGPDGPPPGAVLVSRFAPDGALAWEDTLQAPGLQQESAPAIATNGDIYVPWRGPADSTWLSRIAANDV